MSKPRKPLIHEMPTPQADHVEVRLSLDVNGKDKKGKPCQTCLGGGRVYCCETFEAVLKDVRLEVSVLPYFPGTNMEMNHCHFCGRSLDRPTAALRVCE